MKDPFVPVARALGTTPGQAWTLALGLLLSCALLTASLQAVQASRTAPAAPPAVPTAAPGEPAP